MAVTGKNKKNYSCSNSKKKLDSFEEVKSKYLENLEMEIEFLQ